jgi:hypothetical protein
MALKEGVDASRELDKQVEFDEVGEGMVQLTRGGETRDSEVNENHALPFVYGQGARAGVKRLRMP